MPDPIISCLLVFIIGKLFYLNHRLTILETKVDSLLNNRKKKRRR